MGVAALKIKVMPESPDVSEEVKANIESKMKKAGALSCKIEEEPIAFGLKALIVLIAWPEEKETEIAEKAIREISGVSSLDVIDYRRAFG